MTTATATEGASVMTATATQVRCGNRKFHGSAPAYHPTTADVRACFAGQPRYDDPEPVYPEWTEEDDKAVQAASRPTTAGIFKTANGDIFQVKPSRQNPGRLYAKRLVEIKGERLNEDGDHVQIEFVYAPGAVYRLTEADRMSAEEGKALTLRYGRCLCCGRKLKAAVSVERGIGPVCIKFFR